MSGASAAISSFQHMLKDGTSPEVILEHVDRYIEDLQHLPLTTDGLDEALVEAGDFRSDVLTLNVHTLH